MSAENYVGLPKETVAYLLKCDALALKIGALAPEQASQVNADPRSQSGDVELIAEAVRDVILDEAKSTLTRLRNDWSKKEVLRLASKLAKTELSEQEKVSTVNEMKNIRQLKSEPI